MTPVKSQEQHGSCWAFSSTTSLECDWFIAAGNLLPLSGQQLLGCDTDDSACNGVFVDNGFAFAEKNDLCTEVSYSCIETVTVRDQTCQMCVASLGPFCDSSCKFFYRPKNVRSTNSGRSHAFQDNLRSDFG